MKRFIASVFLVAVMGVAIAILSPFIFLGVMAELLEGGK